jgi:hypothetical protein
VISGQSYSSSLTVVSTSRDRAIMDPLAISNSELVQNLFMASGYCDHVFVRIALQLHLLGRPFCGVGRDVHRLWSRAVKFNDEVYGFWRSSGGLNGDHDVWLCKALLIPSVERGLYSKGPALAFYRQGIGLVIKSLTSANDC